jgi:methenyltetrahydromethanopterin cyclohydrolase
MFSAEGLNQSAQDVFSVMVEHASDLNIQQTILDCGTRILDCGVHAAGGIGAGIGLARLCLAGKAEVTVCGGDRGVWPGAWIQVVTDKPIEACMLGQYAGWPVKHQSFFAMGSGPMRVRRGKEDLLRSLVANDSQALAVGSLECDVLPDCDIASSMAAECDVPASNLSLAVAPTRSIAGCVQVVARSVETALHKMHALGGDLASVRSAVGVAPLAPATPDFALGIGRTNDAILYGGHVTLWIDAEDEQLMELGPQLPSRASRDYGAPFAEIFERYKFDFYQVDPNLFSPAEVVLTNLRSGRSWRFGGPRADLIAQSFATEVA